jgi:hypothetical protein
LRQILFDVEIAVLVVAAHHFEMQTTIEIGLTPAELKVHRRSLDSLLEGAGFELSVPD